MVYQQATRLKKKLPWPRARRRMEQDLQVKEMFRINIRYGAEIDIKDDRPLSVTLVLFPMVCWISNLVTFRISIVFE